MQIFIKEYLLFGLVPMFFCLVLIGSSPVKVPETRFGRGAMIGDLVIAPVCGIEGVATDLTSDLGLECLPGSVYNVHVGTVLRRGIIPLL